MVSSERTSFYVFKYVASSPRKGFGAVEPLRCESIDPECVLELHLDPGSLWTLLSCQHRLPFIKDRNNCHFLAVHQMLATKQVLSFMVTHLSDSPTRRLVASLFYSQPGDSLPQILFPLLKKQFFLCLTSFAENKSLDIKLLFMSCKIYFQTQSVYILTVNREVA